MSARHTRPFPTREIHHAIDIDAPPAAVWAVLADTAAYGEWNPFIPRLEGDWRVGAKLSALVATPGGGRPRTFEQTVLAVQPGRELRWIVRVLVPGLLDGVHSFGLQPLPAGGTRFTQVERFRGLLVRLLGRQIDKTQLGMEQMNGALKRRVEGR